MRRFITYRNIKNTLTNKLYPVNKTGGYRSAGLKQLKQKSIKLVGEIDFSCKYIDPEGYLCLCGKMNEYDCMPPKCYTRKKSELRYNSGNVPFIIDADTRRQFLGNKMYIELINY